MVQSILDQVLRVLSPLHREIVSGLLDGEDADADELIARRHGTTPEAVRVERFVARQRLAEALARDV